MKEKVLDGTEYGGGVKYLKHIETGADFCDTESKRDTGENVPRQPPTQLKN